MKPTLFLLLLLGSFSILAQNREHAFEINEKLGRGVNYGNMFEAPTETEWGNPWHPEYAKMIAELGFNHVRIPIRWEPKARSSSTSPYTINATFLNHIKQVVDSALNNGLIAIMNMHHHEALFDNPDGQKARFLAQWKQISEFFKDYPDDLLFEILNEPHGNISADKWNFFATDALNKIREDNPTRVVLIGTAEYGGLGGLSKLELPNDDNIILTVHYYNPFHFTHQGAEWSEGADAWLGTKWNDTETERQVVQNEFAPLKAFEQQQNVPIHIGEFGSYSKADETSRKKWTTYIARYLESLNWSWAYWEFSAGFGIYNPGDETYNQFLVDALLHNPIPEPAYYTGTPVYSSDFSQNTSGWNVYTQSGASAIKENSSGNLDVTINSVGSENWHVQLVKNNIRLEAGKKYRVTFTAKAAAQRQISAYTGQSSDPWSSYSGSNSFSIGTEFNTFSYVFDMNVNDNAARIVFDLGESSENLTFKSVTLEEIVLQEPSSSVIIKDFKSKIFPNPVNDHLVVSNLDDFKQITLRNMEGQLLINERLNDFENKINTNNLASGTYFVSLVNQKNRYTTKIIKN